LKVVFFAGGALHGGALEIDFLSLIHYSSCIQFFADGRALDVTSGESRPAIKHMVLLLAFFI
jgi:hypothetical protein